MTVTLRDSNQVRSSLIENLKYRLDPTETRITDFNVGSVVNTLFEAFAAEFEQQAAEMLQIATDSLENIYAGFNFSRLPGRKSVAYLKAYFTEFTSTTDLTNINNSDILSISKGAIFTTEDGSQSFECLDDWSPSLFGLEGAAGEFNGKAFYRFRVRSTSVGVSTNVLANTITKSTSGVVNTNSYKIVYRNESAIGGADEETTDAMKLRFQKYLLSLRRGTKEALEYGIRSNVNFTGLMYNVVSYSNVTLLKQYEVDHAGGNYILDTADYLDLTYANKFTDDNTVLESDDASTGTGVNDVAALYVGFDEKFYSLLFVLNQVSPSLSNTCKIQTIKYWDGTTWATVATQSPVSNTTSFPNDDQIITWTITDPLDWQKKTIAGYDKYFVRIEYNSTTVATKSSYRYIKVMTTPYPGYVDIYCLKNYREPLNSLDKTVLAEAIENYKAAGVITSIKNATMIDVKPTLVLKLFPGVSAPSTLASDIRSDIVNYAKSLDVGVDLDRNDLYSMLYTRYGSYGSMILYLDYEVETKTEKFSGFSIIDAASGEKLDLTQANVMIINSLLYLDNWDSGTALTGANYAANNGDFDYNFSSIAW